MIRFKELNYQKGDQLPAHTHDEGQVLFARAGTMEVWAGDKFILIPSTRIAWIPPHVSHSIKFKTSTKMRTAYIQAPLLEDLFKQVQVLQASALFSAVIIKLAEMKTTDEEYRSALAQILLSELKSLKTEPFSLIFPTDKRAKRVANGLLADPSSSLKIEQWAQMAACSSKTLSRIFHSETGMTFQIWRRYLRLLLVHELIENGASVAAASYEVGFSSSSAMSEAHRLTFGFSPSELRKNA